MLKAFKSNPQQAVQQMVANNPEVSKLINQYGSPKDAFYALAKQRGINPDDIIKMLKG